MAYPLSILDLAQVVRGETTADSLRASVDMAQRAEAWGYRRIWYAEHHNMPTIASSATAVLIGQVASATSTIRLGSGGVMLPNHAPLTIAEQFGTLASFHSGRIELGLGRAPGTDQQTMLAMRRDHTSADRFPQDVLELQGYLSGQSRVDGVEATPGKGTEVPLYILGSSLFGAHLAAALGLPYSFASHFAPAALHDAVRVYREEFTPSAQLREPRVIAGVNVVAADTTEQAEGIFHDARRRRVAALVGRGRARGRRFTDEELDALLESPAGAQVAGMTKYSAVGTADQVADYLDRFAVDADADELIVVSQAADRTAWLRTLELLAPLNARGVGRSRAAAA
ncbi:LLM class flavin-dependent oxidoreductase [Tomitella cavernea]|uniref:LLM class flavin-dependent oxidoreductase n=1 Tax=Tomitella cavernea TaxID=1387982 RepID=A0ABP9CN19_9ACTN|nr:LLM class flavin-dependent oxidoreductase [Tomitella cavernea]